MRKRFVRLALIAAVVLVAFLLYRNTEGFGQQATDFTCTSYNNLSAKEKKSYGINKTDLYGREFGKKNNKTKEYDQYACLDQFNVPLEKLGTPLCNLNKNFKAPTKWDPDCGDSNSLTGAKKGQKCYICKR